MLWQPVPVIAEASTADATFISGANIVDAERTEAPTERRPEQSTQLTRVITAASAGWWRGSGSGSGSGEKEATKSENTTTKGNANQPFRLHQGQGAGQVPTGTIGGAERHEQQKEAQKHTAT